MTARVEPLLREITTAVIECWHVAAVAGPAAVDYSALAAAVKGFEERFTDSDEALEVMGELFFQAVETVARMALSYGTTLGIPPTDVYARLLAVGDNH